MAAKMGGEDDGPIVDINITPFVDIILVILIIFMITAPAIINPSINIQLPKAASGEDTTPTQINITISKEGQLALNGKDSNETDLTVFIEGEVKNNPNAQAIIAADKEASHGMVIQIIDLVKQAGIQKFAISTEK